MNIEDTLAPASDQLDACDLTSGPRTFTITSVSKGNVEQPVQVHLAEFPRVWRPGKSMRRVLAACWTAESSTWIGHRVTLYCDPSVRFGPDEVGGTRISHLSHIDGPKKIPLLVSKGRSAMFRVEPLPDEQPPTNWVDLIAAATTRVELTAIRDQAKAAGVTNGKEIDAMLATRAAELKPATQATDADQCPICGTTTDEHDDELHQVAGA